MVGGHVYTVKDCKSRLSSVLSRPSNALYILISLIKLVMSGRRRMPSYRPWGSTEDGAIEFESLSTQTVNGALKVIQESFFTSENVCLGVNLLSEPGAAKELEQLCLEAASDGVSVVAIDVNTQEVVGVAFNKLHIQQDISVKGSFEKFSENCKYKSSKALVDFMINVDARIDLFEHYNATCLLEIMFLATLQNYSQRRIGELLVSSSLELARQLNCGRTVKTAVEINGTLLLTNSHAIPNLVSAIMTSNYSQRISEKLGFDCLVTVSFDEFVFDGKKFSERIGNVHTTSRLVTKKLNTK